MIGRFGPVEILIIVAILVFLFGAKKIPELAKGMGIGIKEFRKGLKEGMDVEEEEGKKEGKEKIPEGFGN